MTTWIDSARASFDRVPIDALRQAPVDSWEHVALKYFWKQMGKHALSLADGAARHGDRAALTRAVRVDGNRCWRTGPKRLTNFIAISGIVYQQLAPSDPSLLDSDAT